MKNTALYVILAALVLGAGYFVLSTEKSVKGAHSFEECVQEGGTVMESYPRQCVDSQKNHFTEEIAIMPEDSLGAYTNASSEDIVSDLPAYALVTSPLIVTGVARGYWFFEASFPVFLTDWDGKIIAEGYASAESEWMTSEFVPYVLTLEFNTPEYGERGTLILKRDNPSGLPENDAALEIPVMFQ